MTGKVYYRLFVRGGHVVDNQLVIICKTIYYGGLYFAREALFAIGTYIFEYQRLVVHLAGVPYLGVEAFLAAVQTVGAVVDGQLVLLAMQLEPAFADAVAVAAHQRREVGLGALYYVLDVVVALYHVGVVAVAVGHHDGYDSTAIVGDSHFITLLIFKDVQIRFFAIDCGLKVFSLQTADVFCFCCAHHKTFLVTLCTCKVNNKK